MNKKFLVGFSVLGIAAAAFWACGDGDVITKGGEDELALLNYGPPFAEGDEGNMKTLVNQALADCSSDEACAAKMEGSTYVPPEESSDDNGGEGGEGGNGGEGNDGPKSSTSGKPGPVVNTSSASTTPVGSSGSGSDNPPPSSTATATNLSVPDGTCSAKPESITKGESVTWTFKPAEVSASNYGAAKMQEYLADKANYEKLVNGSNCNWTIEGGTVTSGNISGTCGDDGKTITVTYATPNNYSASIKLGEKTIPCGTVSVGGASITSCTCTTTETKPDVAGGPATVTWTISGCKTDANIPDEGCEWSGGATGNCKTGTATVSEKNEELQPSVVVKNDEFSTMQVPCTAIKAWDSNNVTETITWPSENTTLTAGTYTITDCKGSTGTKTIQVSGGSSETCNTWFGATGWSGGPWSTCNGQISVSFPVTLEVPEGGSVILSNNCW